MGNFTSQDLDIILHSFCAYWLSPQISAIRVGHFAMKVLVSAILRSGRGAAPCGGAASVAAAVVLPRWCCCGGAAAVVLPLLWRCCGGGAAAVVLLPW